MSDPQVAALLESWNVDASLILMSAGAACLYWRGWRRLHAQMPDRFPAWRLACFVGGLASLLVALESPLNAFGGLLLQVHMIQHLLLTMVAAPLLLLGQPVIAMLRGLPTVVAKDALGPYLRWPRLRSAGRLLTHPASCWLAMAGATLLWHLPPCYEFALRSRTWHEVQHACFLGGALLFWWPVIEVWPATPQWPRWTMIPYLISADVANTLVSATLSFSETVVYPSYAQAPRLWGISALADQAAAGAIMWVPGSLAYLVTAILIAMQLLGSSRRAVRPSALIQITSRPTYQLPRKWDLLHAPLFRLLRRPHARRSIQASTLLLATAVVIDGLTGTQVSPLNLAGVLPWTWWRALAVIALLSLGNLFCMACPFTLPADLLRRFLPARYRWPRPLRNKWVAMALLVTYLWAYDAFRLWDRPSWTAWIILGYFAAATTINLLFEGAAFCKYLCPIGQFHFVNSLASPLAVKVRDARICNTCRSHDCLRGNPTARGCELHLFQPAKSGNLDCTFCLDCVHACPQHNVGIAAVTLQERIPRGRFDTALLALTVVFGAFVNAAAMTTPAMQWMHAWHARTGSMLAAITSFYAAGVIALPAIAACLLRHSLRTFAFALAPLGLAMWTAHISFHLLAAWTSIANFQVCLLGLGLSLTLYLAWRASRRSVRAFAPWAALALALYTCGLWTIAQPMDMRGTMIHSLER